MSRLVVYMDGGLIQDVYQQGEGGVDSLVLLDTDLEGADEDRIVRDPEARRGGFYVQDYPIHRLPEKCQFATVLRKWDKRWHGEE